MGRRRHFTHNLFSGISRHLQKTASILVSAIFFFFFWGGWFLNVCSLYESAFLFTFVNLFALTSHADSRFQALFPREFSLLRWQVGCLCRCLTLLNVTCWGAGVYSPVSEFKPLQNNDERTKSGIQVDPRKPTTLFLEPKRIARNGYELIRTDHDPDKSAVKVNVLVPLLCRVLKGTGSQSVVSVCQHTLVAAVRLFIG